jgi:hypothetical protein
MVAATASSSSLPLWSTVIAPDGPLRQPRGPEFLGASGADVRFDRRPRACLGGGRKRGQENQALGRSRGGFSTKIHLKTDFDGHPIAFDLTGGEKADAPHFPILLGLGPDIDPRAAVGDKGYASKANREAARKRGAIPVIPHKTNEKEQPARFARPSTKAAPASSRRSAS